MKKALWLQLTSDKQTDSSVGDELESYKRLRSVCSRAPGRTGQERLYRELLVDWLREPQNRWCRVYLLLVGKRVPATQCHHYQGRRGVLLLYEPFWIPVSLEGHRWIDEHRERARALG